MVIRFWTYQTTAAEAQRFEEFENREGLPMMLAQSGCLGVDFLRLKAPEGQVSSQVEFGMISKWQSWEHLQTALKSKTWQAEVALFISQHFGENGNGSTRHYEVINS